MVVLSTYQIASRSPVLISSFKYIIVNAFDIAITYCNRLSDVDSYMGTSTKLFKIIAFQIYFLTIIFTFPLS